MILEWVLAILNLVLTYVFVVQFGLIGTELGTSLAISIKNTLQAAVLWRFEGLWPFDFTFLKPLGDGLVLGAVMLGFRATVGGLLAAVLG